jgi:hypothetical protein
MVSGGEAVAPPGQQEYSSLPGIYNWVCPAGVTSVSVVCVGAGGGAGNYPQQGSGGGLGWRNNLTVTPGTTYRVDVGAVVNSTSAPTVSGDSIFNTAGVGGTPIVRGLGGSNSNNGSSSPGGGFVGDGGGTGGSSPHGIGASYAGGGGAAGYTGNGGNGGPATTIYNGATQGTQPTGGGGGGGSGARAIGGAARAGGQGGGVGLLGQGANGSSPSTPASSTARAGVNGTAGSGGGTTGRGNSFTVSGSGAGAVRIIWPGNTRLFPSTNTGNL